MLFTGFLKNISKHHLLYLNSSSIIILLIIPKLLQDGMFMDGQQYGCVAMNLADGKGSFWFPYLNETWWMGNSRNFMEHPPLFYFLQSIFFKVFGNSFYTERIYGLVIMLLNFLCIHLIWNLIQKEDYLKRRMSWMPILFWIILPVTVWAIPNNIIEVTVSVFTLAASYFLIKICLNKGNPFISIILSGCFIFLATLTKGFPGLFPLVIIMLGYFLLGKISLKKSIFYSILVALIPLLIYMLLIIYDEHAKKSLLFYIKERFLNRLEITKTTNNRFYVLYLVIEELSPLIALSVFLYYISRKKIAAVFSSNLIIKRICFFLLIGCFASLPLALTFVQKKMYFIPSLPFFAIGFALLNENMIEKWIEKINENTRFYSYSKKISMLFFIFSICISFYFIGKIGRDEQMISDVKIIGTYLKNETSVDANSEVFSEWSFQFYLLRKYKISMAENINHRSYYISKSELEKDSLIGYKEIILPTNTYKLYKKNISN